MVRYFFSLSVLLISTFCYAQISVDVHKPQSAKQAQLIGLVKTLLVKTQIMKIIDGKAEMDALLSEMEVTYDKSGQMVIAKFYNSNGAVRRINAYTYQGQLLTNTSSDLYNSEGELYRKSEYDYKKDGEINTQVNYDYDEKGHLIRKTILSRDSSGNLTAADYKPGGTLFKRYLFGSPQSGRTTKKVSLPENKTPNELSQKIIYDEIDSHGNWTKMTVFSETIFAKDKTIETRKITYRIFSYY